MLKQAMCLLVPTPKFCSFRTRLVKDLQWWTVYRRTLSRLPYSFIPHFQCNASFPRQNMFLEKPFRPWTISNTNLFSMKRNFPHIVLLLCYRTPIPNFVHYNYLKNYVILQTLLNRVFLRYTNSLIRH